MMVHKQGLLTILSIHVLILSVITADIMYKLCTQIPQSRMYQTVANRYPLVSHGKQSRYVPDSSQL